MTATEAERRRAAGEAGFCDNAHAVLMAETFTRWELATPVGGFEVGWWAREMVAVYLRALVLQELVDRIVAWCEEVSS